MKVIDKIGNIITYILIFLISIILIFMTYSYISLNIQKKDYVSLFRESNNEFASGSMEPAVNKNDLVILILSYNLYLEFYFDRLFQIDINWIFT